MVTRGEVVIVHLDAPVDSAPAKRRPMVIVQADRFNGSRLATTVAIAVTSDLALAEYPGNVFLPAIATGLRRDSVAVVTQITTVDLRRIVEHVDVLPQHLRDDIDRGMKLALEL